MATIQELEAALADLRAHADELNKLDDRLTAKIPEVEEALRGLHLGVRISVRIDARVDWEKLLAFDKFGQTWRLLVEEGPLEGGDAEDWNTTPLASAPRDERAAVFSHYLDELLLSAGRQVKTKIEERRRSLEGTDAVIETVKKASVARKVKP